jgi:putative ABC transport system permease protein
MEGIMVESIWNDVRYAARMMIRNPLFAIAAVGTLALGIGANSAVFSVIDTILLRPLPFGESDRLVLIRERSPQQTPMSVSYPNFSDWRHQNHVFTDMAIHRTWDMSLTAAEMPERVQLAEVSPHLFSVLQVEPAAGRFFLQEEGLPDERRVVVLGYELWQRRFGGDPGILGQTIDLDDVRYTVVGIAPREFVYPLDRPDVEIYGPLGIRFRDYDHNRGTRAGFRVTARLRDGVSLEQVRANMAIIASSLEQEYPEANEAHTVRIDPLKEYLVGDTRPGLFILMAAVGLVLLIACANVANLLLARASTRAREIALRSSLGAHPARVIRQLLTESVLLSILGGALGVLIAIWGVQLIVLVLPDDLPAVYRQIAVNEPVLGFTLLLSVLTGFVFGLIPAVHMSRQDLAGVLRAEGRGASGGVRRTRFRNALVIAEISLAVLLLVSAALLMRSFSNLTNANPGFNPANLLTLQLILKLPEAEQRAAFIQEAEERITALPGVRSVALSTPLLSGWTQRYALEDRPPPGPDGDHRADLLFVTAGYFRTMEIPLLKGRSFSDRDRVDAPRVAIVDQRFAAKHWPAEDPIGKHVSLLGGRFEIAGVAGHVKNYGVEAESREELYLHQPQLARSSLHMLVRTESNPERLVSSVRGILGDLAPGRPAFNVRTMVQHMGIRLATRRATLLLVAAFASIALSLAAGGIYSVIAYSVTLRRHEFGIRMAMGANARDVHKLVLVHALRVTLIGVALGLGTALLTTSLLSSMLFGVGPRDLATFVGVGVVSVVVALVASMIPAIRATRILPMVVLRDA